MLSMTCASRFSTAAHGRAIAGSFASQGGQNGALLIGILRAHRHLGGVVFDTAAAYEVAPLIHEARLREGAAPVGRKVGFTNRDLWPASGVRESIWAYVYGRDRDH